MTEALILVIAALLGLFSMRFPLPEISRRFTFALNLQVSVMVVVALLATQAFDSTTMQGVRNYQLVMRMLIVWLALIAGTLATLQVRHAIRERSATRS